MSEQSYLVKINKNYDVVIIGAGPAGCMAACHLDANLSVLLADSQTLPKYKSCGGALNHYAWDFLQKFNPPEDILVEPKTINFRYVDWNRNIYRPTGLIFRNSLRYKFDAWLLTLLPPHIEVSSHTSLKGFDFSSNGILVHLTRDGNSLDVETKYLIDASGAGSETRVLLGRLVKEYYRTVQFWVKTTKNLEPFFDCILMNRITNGHAYSYIMPKDAQAIVGSVFYPNSRNVVQKHDLVIETLNKRLGAFGKVVKKEASKALKVSSGRELFLGKKNVLVTGEAAGFISPTSGEGISYALNSGMLCAQAINDGGKDALKVYRKKVSGLTRNLKRKMNKFTILARPSSRLLLSIVPPSIISRVTMKL